MNKIIILKNIPFLNFTKRNADVKDEVLKAFEDFFDSGWYVLGNRLLDFEKEYAKYVNCQFCVGVSTGLDAITLALEALGVGEGDEIIVPSNTYIATVLAVTNLGAVPIFVEPNIDTYNIDINKIEQKITKKTRAIIPVHLYGQPCEMDEIMKIANENKLFVVEDNAQAQGARYKNQYTSTFGHANAVSFYPGKNLGALGEAGAVTTNDVEIEKKVKALRNYGSEEKYINKFRGYNMRMDEIQGAILSKMLIHLDKWNEERKIIANYYLEGLKEIKGIILPAVANNAFPVWHQFVIRIKNRDSLQNYLASKGIATMIHYPIPPHLQECYRDLGYKEGDFPLAEELANSSLSLPIYPGLSEQKVNYIIEQIRNFNY